jgi:chromate transporter
VATSLANEAVEGEVPAAVSPAQPIRPGPLELFRVFFRIGLTSFGMAILQNIRSIPVQRGWLSRAEIDEGLGLVQLYPGAMMVDLVAYVGYRTARITGALAAAAGFVAPSLVLMLALSWLYETYGAAPGVASLVVGLDALVVGVVASVAVDFARQHSNGRVEALLGLAAFAVGAAGANLVWAVLAGLVVGALALRSNTIEGATVADDSRLDRSRLARALVPGLVVAAGVAVAALASGIISGLVLDMAKIGSIAFGNGSTILPILQQDVVESRHWLSLPVFGVAVGFGQVTPGPFLITAAFVGYHVAGLWGGILATVAIFAPSIAMTTVAAEIYPYLRDHAWVKGAIAGVMAVFVGLLATVVLSLGRQVLPVPAALVLAAAAFVAVRVFKLNLIVVFGAGIVAWAAFLALSSV